MLFRSKRLDWEDANKAANIVRLFCAISVSYTHLDVYKRQIYQSAVSPTHNYMLRDLYDKYAGQGLEIYQAVSYTHLDVYKRQEDGFLAASVIIGKKLILLKAGNHLVVTAWVDVYDTLHPVSYTHLDVYKRQGQIAETGYGIVSTQIDD